MVKEFEAMVLAMIYPRLPPHIQKKVMVDILNKCGFKFSLQDLADSEPPAPTTMRLPIFYKPAIYCRFCGEKLKELNENKQKTPELEAKLLDEHLPNCSIFKVIEKHKRGK